MERVVNRKVISTETDLKVIIIAIFKAPNLILQRDN